MLMKRIPAVFFALLLVFATLPALAQSDEYAVGESPEIAAAPPEIEGFREILWDDLIPPDWLSEDMFDHLFEDDENLDQLEDTDPRAMALMEKVREMWDDAPVVAELDGEHVRIPGFVVPLEGDDKTIREFLLVPYFGACIHVPPPPANQLIHVVPDEPVSAEWNMAPVWVAGDMTVDRRDSELGTSGYRMRGIKVMEYE